MNPFTASHGEYFNTLNVVDVATGWSECLILANRSQRQVSAVMERLRERLPFPLLGIDSDNDAAFINDNLYRYCQQEQVTFTRSRPYKKNDQGHVEQKNWSAVRRLIGYRYPGDEDYQQYPILSSPLTVPHLHFRAGPVTSLDR